TRPQPDVARAEAGGGKGARGVGGGGGRLSGRRSRSTQRRQRQCQEKAGRRSKRGHRGSPPTSLIGSHLSQVGIERVVEKAGASEDVALVTAHVREALADRPEPRR